MKIMNINYVYSDQSFLFATDEEADAVYAALSAQLKEYQRFRNDRAETFEFEAPCGAKTTVRLEHINCVTVFNCTDPLQEEWAGYQGRLAAARDRAKAQHILAR